MVSSLPIRMVSAPVRVNMVVALADLCHRWPNVLEPWTAYMYEPLAGEHLLLKGLKVEARPSVCMVKL